MDNDDVRAWWGVIGEQADAEAIEIRGAALKGNEVVLEDRYIEALKEGETIYVGEQGIALTRETGENDSDE